MYSKILRYYLSLLLWVAATACNAAHPGDPHYTESGFFDIHICNWPDRPPFYMVLYHTRHLNTIQSVIISDANGNIIGELDPARYRILKRNNQPAEKVLVAHIPVSDGNKDGWFTAEVYLKDGRRHIARDLVRHQIMPLVTGLRPQPGAEDVRLPMMLRWNDVDGAYWYRLFIRDMWDDEKLIYASRILPFPDHDLPNGLLKPGGYYSWKVHARDAKGDPELGDFNAGSQSRWIEFSVAGN